MYGRNVCCFFATVQSLVSTGLAYLSTFQNTAQGFYVDLSFHRVPRNMCAQPHDA